MILYSSKRRLGKGMVTDMKENLTNRKSSMKTIQSIAFHSGSREELLPDFDRDFPCIASRAEIDQYIGRYVPWHWHKAVELFYMESGTLEYNTPGGKICFPAGSGGLVNSNVLHSTRALSQTEKTVMFVHLFDTSLIAGEQGGRIEQKYILPLTTASRIEIIPLFPEDAAQREILDLVLRSFYIPCDSFGYEIKLREALSQIWLMLFERSRSLPTQNDTSSDRSNNKIKQMMIYIHEHYPEKISVSQLAAAAYLSERECFRVFHDCLHMTPVDYIKTFRLQAACRMLAQSDEPITSIGHACGLGSSSYFGKVFKEYTGLSPTKYRQRWQNIDNFRQ